MRSGRKAENHIMSSLLLTAPAVEPLSLAEARAFLRVETADDDDLIRALIAARACMWKRRRAR
jgi:uncharacterized phiE125 gp8 family phage protein